MAIRILLAGAALLASGSAWAQATSEQTSADLVCQLAETCEAPAETATGETTEAPASPGGPRVTNTRGFKIARQVEAKDPPRATSGGKAQVVAPGKRVTTTAPGKARKPAAGMKAMTPGRADLRLTFVTGSAELTEAGQREALKFIDALNSPLLSGMRFTIEGHTDAVGSRPSNLDLSKRRAQAVVDYLVGKGAERSRFEVQGYGYDRPLAGLSAHAAANRRVEVVRIKK